MSKISKLDKLFTFRKIIFRRLWRRLKYVFLFRDLLWEYESCQDCGHCFNLRWSCKDEIWLKVMNTKEGGSLCIDCFTSRASKIGMHLTHKDFEYIEFFNPWSSLDIEEGKVRETH